MAKNKHALIRYRALDACFRNHRIRYCFKDLMEAVNRALEAYDFSSKGISRSMLYEDISFMESTDGWRAEIERIRDGKTMYLRYADPTFSIRDGP
ncbi:MAG: WYL domain-containing protein, partial [Chitinophagaceae bacterium]